jgi:hypothetical protein
MTVGLGFILVILAAIQLGVAALLVALAGDTTDTLKIWQFLMASGCATGFVGVKVP